MPRIELRDPFGTSYRFDTRREKAIQEWFTEVLPHMFIPEDHRGPATYPQISVYPIWPWGRPASPDTLPDWVTDSRALGQLYTFQARNGQEGIRALRELRRRLEQEIVLFDTYGPKEVYAGHFPGFPITAVSGIEA